MSHRQNRELIQGIVNEESGNNFSSQDLSSSNDEQQENYEAQINSIGNNYVDVNEDELNTLSQSWSKRLLKENSDLLKNHIPGTFSQYQHAKISSQDPKLMLVHGKYFCRLLDLSQPSANVLHNIIYNTQQQELEFADFESDFLVTVVSNKIDNILHQQPLIKSVIAQADQQTFVELRRVRNLTGHSDFVQIPLRAGVRVAKVKISLENAIDGSKIPFVFILRKNENIVETKMIQRNGRVEHHSCIPFVSMDPQTRQELQLEDINIFRRTQLLQDGCQAIQNWIALNFSQYAFQILTTNDYLQQRDAGEMFELQRFYSSQCPSHRLIELEDMYNNGVRRSKLTQVISIEFFRMNIDKELLILVRQSLDVDQTPHDIDVIDIQTRDLLENAEIKLPITAQQQIHANQRPWLRRILDTCSSDKGLYILVQEAAYLFVYMIHPNQSEIKIVQVNKSQHLDNPSTLEDLMAARIIRRSVDLPSQSDVSLSVILISQAGTEVTELDISYKYETILQKYAAIDSQHLIETQQKLFGRPNNDSSDFSLFIPDQKSDLVNALITNRQFKKLAEVVLMRNQHQASAAKGQYVFEQMGTLPMLLRGQIQQQRDEEIMRILSITKYLQSIYESEEQEIFQSTVDTRREVIKSINLEIRRIDGIQTVYEAVLKRQNDQAQDISLKTTGNRYRDKDLKEIEQIKKYIQQVVQKQANLLRILLFVVQSDYLRINKDKLKDSYKSLCNSDIWCLPNLNPVLQNYSPTQFPLLAVSDLVNLFDSSSAHEHCLQLIYYQLLSQPSHIRAHFDQVLGGLLCEDERRNLRAIWSVDHLGIAQDAMRESQIVEELNRTQERHSHLDHLIFQKLCRASPQGKEAAQMYLNSGACRSQVQLSNFETLRVILDFYANNNNLQGFIANYLRETESQIKSDLYERILEAYMSLVARSVDQAYQKSLLQIQLTKKQTLIIESILQANYPTLMITYKLSRRQVPQALGTAMRIGHTGIFNNKNNLSSSQQHFSKSYVATSETASLVHNYMATLRKDQQRQTYEESKVGPAAQQEIYADISSNYKAIGKIRYPGAASSKESDKIFFDPSKNRQMVDVQQEQAKQVSSSKNTFTDFFGFTDSNQLPEPIKFSELVGQAPSFIDFAVPSIPAADSGHQDFVRLFNGPVQIVGDTRIQGNLGMRQDPEDHEMQQDERNHSHDESGHSQLQFVTDNQGNYPPLTSTSAHQPRPFMGDPLNGNADFLVSGAQVIHFPTQGSSDEMPGIFQNDENLLDGSSIEGIQMIPDLNSSSHMKIEEQQQITETESELRMIMDEQRRLSRQYVPREMMNITETPHESDSQSNNNTIRGSFGGDLAGLNRSYGGPTGGGGAANMTPTIDDQITHRNSMPANASNQIQIIDASQQYEEQKDENTYSSIDSDSKRQKQSHL